MKNTIIFLCLIHINNISFSKNIEQEIYILDMIATYPSDLKIQVPDFKEKIVMQVEAANLIYKRSGIKLNLNLIGIEEVNDIHMSSRRTPSEILKYMNNNHFLMNKIKNKYHQTYMVAHFIKNQSRVEGIANLNSEIIKK